MGHLRLLHSGRLSPNIGERRDGSRGDDRRRAVSVVDVGRGLGNTAAEPGGRRRGIWRGAVLSEQVVSCVLPQARQRSGGAVYTFPQKHATVHVILSSDRSGA